MTAEVTLGGFFDSLAPGIWREPEFLAWPPDVFALCGAALERTGAYLHVANNWPPQDLGICNAAEWQEYISALGQEWKNAFAGKNPIPKTITQWWQDVVSAAKTPLPELYMERNAMELAQHLLLLCTAADEACAGLGFPRKPGTADAAQAEFIRLAQEQGLSHGRVTTLCRLVHPERVRVLPKLCTPPKGVSFRSMTHHLALCRESEVIPEWKLLASTCADRWATCANVLLFPWPLHLRPRQFTVNQEIGASVQSLPEGYGFFSYEPMADGLLETLGAVLTLTKKDVDTLEMLILPELSIPEALLEQVLKVLQEHFPGCILIAGTAGRTADSPFSENEVQVHLPHGLPTQYVQAKHHRWLLEPAQINSYALDRQFAPGVSYWEDIPLLSRELNFLPLAENLTMCCLICEDIARQDPMAQVVRAVGPNLVIALLMDGPQIQDRWPVKYATVLADDPGSSVLTLSSLGMLRLSRPAGMKESRVIAHWQDAKAPPAEIDLPDGASAVLLSLRADTRTEYTADGRVDESPAQLWQLASSLPIYT